MNPGSVYSEQHAKAGIHCYMYIELE